MADRVLSGRERKTCVNDSRRDTEMTKKDSISETPESIVSTLVRKKSTLTIGPRF